jgi:hypothetical protein
MPKFKVTFEVYLHDDKTDWIETAIEEQLESGEAILDGNIEEITHE